MSSALPKTIATLMAIIPRLSLVPAFAHSSTEPPPQLYPLDTLTLENGEVIQDFVLSYVRHGTLNTTKSNAILFGTALGGNHHRLDSLIPWLQGVRDSGRQRMDASDWLYQSWTIDQHNLGATPGLNSVRRRWHEQ